MKLIVFDLDGTLAESKQPLTPEMAALVAKLLEHLPVAVISGGALPQFLSQVVSQLPKSANLSHLYLLPTSGASLYAFRSSSSFQADAGAWNKIYEERISEKDAHTIEEVLRAAAAETGVINFSDKSWGERIEWRGGQVSISALGQQAPVTLKKAWDPDHSKRQALQAAIMQNLPPGFTAAMGGTTTIDVTKDGVDKAYGLRKLCERLGIAETNTLYVGDELEAGGNDEAIYKTNAKTKSVSNLLETKQLIEKIIAALNAQGG
ncbi:HAD-IIB family hydrolase [Candidatus Parcubacteria bacterium]|nr:HAD-IIB family hydrolase [Candidatus Parcubacteria bacterium]